MDLTPYRKIIFYSFIALLVLGGLLSYIYYFLFNSIKTLSEEIYNQRLALEVLKEQKKIQKDFSQEVYHRFPLVKDIEESLLNTETLVSFLEKIESLAKTNGLVQEIKLKREESSKKGIKKKQVSEGKNRKNDKETKTSTNQTTADKKSKADQKISPYVNLEIILKGEFADIMYYLEGFEKLESLPEVTYYEWQRKEERDKEGNIAISPELQLLIRARLFCPPLTSE